MSTYVLGRSQHETRRLELQRRLYADHSAHLLITLAGLRTSMRAVDVGRGTGELTSIAARIVGPSGHEVGVDHDPDLPAVAERTMAHAGLSHLTSRQEALPDITSDRPAGAPVGAGSSACTSTARPRRPPHGPPRPSWRCGDLPGPQPHARQVGVPALPLVESIAERHQRRPAQPVPRHSPSRHASAARTGGVPAVSRLESASRAAQGGGYPQEDRERAGRLIRTPTPSRAG
ncbi:hypothetical protein [Streptomyces sp. JW3]|uniref:hypothetical protein n=1 Tax=Streptomyces sp. JW3 TaxID=3456955 RepID=UPI003FA44E83